MTRNFILLDQSIKGNGGHHLEYAKRVLNAAKSMGYTTILAVHKECEDISCPDIDFVENVFSHTVWDNFRCEKQIVKAPGVSLLDEFIEGKDRFVFAFLHAQLRYGYHLLTATKAYRAGQLGSPLYSPPHLAAGPTVFSQIQSLFKRWRTCKPITRPTRANYLRPGCHLLRLVGAFTLIPVVAALVLMRWRSSSLRYHECAERFAKECTGLFIRLGVKEGDQVFIPTLGGPELTGVALCSQERYLAGLHWHLLFRRDPFNISELSHVSHNNVKSRTQAIFAEFKKLSHGSHVFFYTDTELLTELYDHLNVFKFETLPIPLDESLGRNSVGANPLVVSYIGDAREEKGFHLLLDLIRSVRAAGFDHNKVVFKLQSNFPDSRLPSSVKCAKAALLSLSDIGVELLGGPFASSKYIDLINSSDIILVPYDAEQYYARSSGIFAEALAAGVPTVYPLKSWMGTALVKTEQAYCHELEQRCQQSEWSLANNQCILVPECEGVSVVFFRYRKDETFPGRFVRLSLQPQLQSENRSRNTDNGHSAISVVLDMRLNRGLQFIQAVPAGSYRIEMIAEGFRVGLEKNSGSQPPFSDFDYRVSVLAARVPAQSTSAGFDLVERIDDALIELITQYPSYALRCKTFATSWRAIHSASRLVQLIEGAQE